VVVGTRPDEEPGSDPTKFFRTDRRHRPFVQAVPPEQQVTRQPGPGQVRGITVAHMQRSRHPLLSRTGGRRTGLFGE